MDKDRIRPIAICLFQKDNRILVSEAFDPSKQDYYCRPIGGAIEFGENSCDAMLREIREEINAEVKNLKLVGVLESIFQYKGALGHEIVFVYDAEFVDENLYQKSEIDGYESGIDARFTAKWFTLEEMTANNLRLVPDGIAKLFEK